MGKEAKFGLAIVVVLLIGVGGFFTWKKFSKPSLASALDNPAPKDKKPIAADPKTEKPDLGLPQFQLPPLPAGKAEPNKGRERTWGKTRGDHKSNPPAETATALPPPPNPSPDPGAPGAAPMNNPYAAFGDPSGLPTTDPMGPPGEAAVASAGDENQLGMTPASNMGNFRARDALPLAGSNPPEMTQPAPLPSRRGQGMHNNALRQGPPTDQPIADQRFAPRGRDERSLPLDRDDRHAGNSPYRSGPRGSLTASENPWPPRHPYGRSAGPDYSNNGFRGDGTYDVQPNESFWKISEKVYGNGAYFAALEELNRDKLVDGRLKIGSTILTPDVAELERKFPGKCPKANHRQVQQDRDVMAVSARNLSGTRSYTVVEGDTLFDIARYELGKASRWAEIYELNSDVLGKDFDYLVPGTELALPEDNPQRPDPVTQRPGRYSRR